MTPRTWLITGVSSGFGHALATQLLERGDRVISTVRTRDKVADLLEKHPAFTPRPGRHRHSGRTEGGGRVVRGRPRRRVVSNAGYGLFGTAEELTDAQVDHIIATNLIESIT